MCRNDLLLLVSAVIITVLPAVTTEQTQSPSCVASWRIQLLTFITVNQMINVMLLFVNTHHKKNPSTRYAICFQNIHCVVLSINEQIRHRSKLQIMLEGSLPSSALQCLAFLQPKV